METLSRDTPNRAPSRIRKSWLPAALIAGTLIATGCGGGAEVVLLVPFFTFGFSFTGTVGGANHDIFLNINPNAPTSATGNFEAGSTLRSDTQTNDVTGTFTGCTMSLNLTPQAPATVVSAPLAASYNGRFTGANTIELTPTSGTAPVLTLTRAGGQTDPRAQTC